MALKPFHIVLICSAILLGLGFALHSFHEYEATQAVLQLWTAVASAAAAVVLTVYLFYFLKKMKKKDW